MWLLDLCDTNSYLSPKALKCNMHVDDPEGYSKEVDLWACGVIMYTVGKSMLQVPYTGTQVLDNTRPFLLSSIVSFGITPACSKEHKYPGGGGTQMARGGIRLVHGHTKSILIPYFSCMKIDPKYAFLHAFFLICLSCPFQNLSI